MMAENEEVCRIAIIGSGVMGGGLGSALSNHHQVSFYDRSYDRASSLAEECGARASKDIAGAVKDADIIILAIKPQDLEGAAKELFGKIRGDQVLVSILGGVTHEMLKLHFVDTTVLRMMPNIPCFYGEGVIAFADTGEFSKEEKKEIEEIFWPLGKLYWLPENKMNAVTALAGSGPAFAFLIVESMVDAAVTLGVSHDQAKDIAIQMFLGALTTLRETGKHPGELKWEVTSPGGCTIAGVKTFEDESIRSGLINTFLSTYESLQGFSE
jgi:pyrroline-5-carboxylate reductase